MKWHKLKFTERSEKSAKVETKILSLSWKISTLGKDSPFLPSFVRGKFEGGKRERQEKRRANIRLPREISYRLQIRGSIIRAEEARKTRRSWNRRKRIRYEEVGREEGEGGGGEEESRGCFPPVVSLARIQRKSNDRLHDRFCQADNRLVAELIYTCTGRKSGIWFTAKIPSDKGAAGERVQPGRDDKFIRLQCSCTTTPPSFPSPDRFLFSHYARTKLIAVHRTSLRDEISFRSILNNSEREDSISFARTIYFDRSISFECIILREGRWDPSLGTMEDESRKWMMKTWSLTNL